MTIRRVPHAAPFGSAPIPSAISDSVSTAPNASSLASQQDKTGKLATTAQAPGQPWERWPESQHYPHHSIDTYYTMDISGVIQSYDSRVTSSAPLNRTIMAPQYMPNPQYTTASMVNPVVAHQNVQHNPFSCNPYTGGSINVLVPIPAYANTFVQQRPVPRSTQPGHEGNPGMLYAENNRQGFVEELHGQSPNIKAESQWNSPIGSPPFPLNTKTVSPIPQSKGASEVTFRTEIDTLMKAIQAKPQSVQPQETSSRSQSRSVPRTSSYTQGAHQVFVQPGTQDSHQRLTRKESHDGSYNSKDGDKRYKCSIPNCSMAFGQKTHLDIHERCHTGERPYRCSFAGCDSDFSQLGNLKTHERRHTGERPFQCDTCGKTFAQRSNVQSHKTTHEQQKRFPCRLDACGKLFTQLGNLKSHQNKFHAPTIRDLTARFASSNQGELFNAADKELWEYFSKLYKNSNKGIKGRGKDRKVGLVSASLASGMRRLAFNTRRGYTMAGAVRGNVVMRPNHGLRLDNPYVMFDADDGNQSGRNRSRSSTISAASSYGDTSPDRF